MRSNSGKGEARNNLHDPTLRDRTREPSKGANRSDSKAPADHRGNRKD